jgi:hypothetical protein
MSEHKYPLRVPSAVWEELKASAAANRRSVNSEILWRVSLVSLSSGPRSEVTQDEASIELAMEKTARAEATGAAPFVPAVPFEKRNAPFRPDFKGGKR